MKTNEYNEKCLKIWKSNRSYEGNNIFNTNNGYYTVVAVMGVDNIATCHHSSLAQALKVLKHLKKQIYNRFVFIQGMNKICMSI